jgi:hypothetical protein
MPKKPTKSTRTVNVDAVKREAKKLAQQAASSSQGREFSKGPRGEVAPGSVVRQSPLEQEMGTNKYHQMIHEHNDKNKHILDRLPFQFPKKKVVRSHLDILLICPECGVEKWGTENTVGFICSSCHKFVKPLNAEAERRGYNPDINVGFRGTALDKLRLKDEADKKKSH